MIAFVILATTLAPRRNWKRLNAFFVSSILAVLFFVPGCMGIMVALDPFRFGTFEYDSFAEVNDFRVERYLPPDAKDIVIFKPGGGNGYQARYRISPVEFRAYLDKILKHGIETDVDKEGVPVSIDEMMSDFRNLDWPPLQAPVRFRSPFESDGGGATYYNDGEAGIVYQRVGYW